MVWVPAPCLGELGDRTGGAGRAGHVCAAFGCLLEGVSSLRARVLPAAGAARDSGRWWGGKPEEKRFSSCPEPSFKLLCGGLSLEGSVSRSHRPQRWPGPFSPLST